MTDFDDDALRDRIMTIARAVPSRAAGRADLRPDDALVDVGFSSLDMANLMLAIEADFDVMIPSVLLTPANFRSVASIARMMARVVRGETRADQDGL